MPGVRTRALLVTVIGILCLAGFAAPVGADPDPLPAATAEHVVLIGFDGFDPDYLGRAATPYLDALAARGAFGVTSSVMLPITNPSFTAIATGAWPDRNDNLAYWWDRTTNTYQGQSRRSPLPSIADAVGADGGTVGAAQYFILQGNGTDYGQPASLYTQPGGACSRRFDDAIAMLRTEPVSSAGTPVTVPQIPTLLAVYCDDLDAIGHAEGAESPNIPLALAELDAQVGRLLDALDEVGIAERTTVVLSGDHGMTSYDRSFALPLNAALQAQGFTPQWLFTAGQQVNATSDVVITSTGRSLSIYLAGALEGDADALAAVRSVVEGVEGTGRIIERTEFPALHLHPGYGDLIVESAPGWGASILPPTSVRGDHGSSDELDAVFVMAGAGVAATAEPVAIRHIDIAPTIAALLGLPPLPDADGVALSHLFVPPPTTASTSTTSTSTSTTTSTPPSTTAPPPSSAPGSTSPPVTTTPPVGPAVSTEPVGGAGTSPVAVAAVAVPGRPTYIG